MEIKIGRVEEGLKGLYVVTLVAVRRQQSQQVIDPQPVDHTEAPDRRAVRPEEGRQPDRHTGDTATLHHIITRTMATL